MDDSRLNHLIKIEIHGVCNWADFVCLSTTKRDLCNDDTDELNKLLKWVRDQMSKEQRGQMQQRWKDIDEQEFRWTMLLTELPYHPYND